MPDGFDPGRIDDAIHAPLRLSVMAYLSGANAATFPELKAVTNATDGNLSVHLKKLEEAGYVTIEKVFEGKKPVTRAILTPSGRAAWIGYLDEMRRLVEGQ
jgi:DNA-binding MarR family transcriptional regulator